MTKPFRRVHEASNEIVTMKPVFVTFWRILETLFEKDIHFGISHILGGQGPGQRVGDRGRGDRLKTTGSLARPPPLTHPGETYPVWGYLSLR